MSERRYGYFRCNECNSTWESSHVYRHGSKAVYKQDCKSCDTACIPYRVEKLICSSCHSQICTCTREERRARHIDQKKPHRSDLCHKCKAGSPCQDSSN